MIRTTDSPFGRARSFGLFINYFWWFITIFQFESHFLLDSLIDNASTGSRSRNIEIMLNSFKSWLTIEHWVDNWALYSEPSQLLRSKPVFHFSVTSNIKPFFCWIPRLTMRSEAVSCFFICLCLLTLLPKRNEFPQIFLTNEKASSHFSQNCCQKQESTNPLLRQMFCQPYVVPMLYQSYVLPNHMLHPIFHPMLYPFYVVPILCCTQLFCPIWTHPMLRQIHPNLCLQRSTGECSREWEAARPSNN